jgi:heme-degrading monooxygenase HmoA
MTAESPFAKTPQPPYYTVVFSSQRSTGDDGYAAMADTMEKLARTQPGYLGHESVRGGDGFGLTVSYWKDEASIKAWKAVAEHHAAQVLGYKRWYQHYQLRVARVERAYSGPEGRADALAQASALD